METLIIQLQKTDAKNYKKIKNFKWLYFGLLIFYTLLMVVNPDPELMWHQRISGLCYVIAFVFLFFIFKKYQKDLHSIDYALPLSELLSKAANRYKWTQKPLILLILPLLLIDAGITLSLTYRFGKLDMMTTVLIIQAIYFSVLIIAAIIGYLVWRKTQKPLRDRALQLLNELNPS